MTGIDFVPLTQVIQLFINQLALVLGMLNIAVAIVGLTITELSKDILPDNIESKWVRIIGVVSCIIISFIPAFNCGIVSAFVTGSAIVGGYALIFKFIETTFEQILKFKNGNGNKPIIPPITEVKK